MASVALCPIARADVQLAGDLGIGKRYRPDGWIPVTVYVRKTDSDVVHGQVQAFADPDPLNHTKQNQNQSPQAQDLGPPPAVFSTAAPLTGPAGSISTYRLYVRNIDPVEDNLTLQYRTGEERGDGNVLAKLPMNGSHVTMSNLGGVPIVGSDPWVITVAPDPAAFSFLNGRKLGLVHTHSGARDVDTVPKATGQNASILISAVQPPSVQVTPAGPADLPDREAGYSGVDAVMIRCDAPLDALTEAQTDALRDWVASGGHLVVTSGSDPTGLTSPALREMLPASVDPITQNVKFDYPGGGSIGAVATTKLLPKPFPGIIVLKSSEGMPLAVSGPYGAGRVTVTAFDPSTTAFSAWQGPAASTFWRQTLTGGDTRPASIMAYVAGREEADGAYWQYGDNSQIITPLLRATSLDAPPVGMIALYLVVYIVVLVPLNYLILKRLDRREWAWVTIPALVVIFSGATYAIGYAAKGGRLYVNRVTIAETSAGSSAAGVYSAFGVFSPHRHDYDVDVADSGALICQPNTYRGNYYYDQQDNGDLGSGDPAHFYQGATDPRIQGASINMWAIRTFDVQSAGTLGGPITGAFSNGGGRLRGTIKNQSTYSLTGCYFCAGGKAQTIGDIPAGDSASIDLAHASDLHLQHNPDKSVHIDQFPTTAFSDGSDSEDDSGDIDDTNATNMKSRLKSGTIDFIRSLGNDDSESWWRAAGPSDEPRILYEPRPDEAILVGWAQGAGGLDPKITLDGAETTGGNSLTMLIVHIPLRDKGINPGE